jgi:hypothetical protein
LTAYISANIGATNKLPSTDALHFGQRRGFGPHQDVINIFSMTHKVLQVKCTVTSLAIALFHDRPSIFPLFAASDNSFPLLTSPQPVTVLDLDASLFTVDPTPQPLPIMRAAAALLAP